MYYEFYIDQFFAEQFLTGYLLLAGTAMLCRAPARWWRLVFGSAAGAAVMSACVGLGIPWYPAGFLTAAAVTFWRKELRKNWKYNLGCTGALLLMTLCFGGALDVLLTFVRLPLMAAAAVAMGGICMTLQQLRGREQQIKNRAAVTLVWMDRSLVLEGFLDTGNQLREPLTGRPVSIANEEALTDLLGGEWEERRGFCLIPYHSLGTDQGWLRGVTLDEMRVEMRRGEESAVRVLPRPVVALYDGQVSAGKTYQIILHMEHAP